MRKIKIGYIRGKENTHVYREQLQYLNNLNINKIFHDKTEGISELSAMVNYIRSKDIIFIYSIEVMGKNLKSTIRCMAEIYKKKADIVIKKEKLNTQDMLGKYALSLIVALDTINGSNDIALRDEMDSKVGRLPRELSDLKVYMEQVENKNMTVKEVCEKMNIGRTTYYRRCKLIENINKEKGELI